VLSLQTYRGAARPAKGKLDFNRRTVVVATVETATHQLVVFAFRRGFPRPTAAVFARLTHALTPVTSADIDRLPEDWSEIGQSRPYPACSASVTRRRGARSGSSAERSN
jgi:hypothetical protein